MNDEHYQPQPEDDGALLYWMYCEELANQPEQTEEPDDYPIGFDDPPPF